jgi:octaprenyl-diphosphate synthase
MLGGRIQNVSEDTEEQLRQFGHAFGMVFQIQDDILDLSGSALSMGKPVGQDDDGKQCTLPLILAFERASSEQKREFIEGIHSESGIRFRHEFIRGHNGLELAIQKRDEYSAKALGILSQWPTSSFKDGLDGLIAFNRIRNK